LLVKEIALFQPGDLLAGVGIVVACTTEYIYVRDESNTVYAHFWQAHLDLIGGLEVRRPNV